MGKILYNGYCDETGNSGLNLFDSSQPEFWVGTLLSQHDLQYTATSELKRLLALIGETELHANKMGLSKIEQIATGLRTIYENNNCTFVFSCINKVDLAKIKFFDYLFDSTTNPGVNTIHYGVRTLRFGLVDAFCHAISEKTAQHFWSIYDHPEEPDILSLLVLAEREIRFLVSDTRIVELFTSAFKGAKEKPLEVFNTSKSLMDSPNAVAFSQLIVGINRIFSKDTALITNFYHDEQNQFGSSLIEMYDLINMVRPDWQPESFVTDLSLIKNFACPLKVIPSQNNTGLQLIDVALWLCKRHVYSSGSIVGDCERLIRFLQPRIQLFQITAASMREEYIKMSYEVLQRPTTPEQLEEGMRLFQQVRDKGF